MKPTLENLVSGLIGKTAQANHPITCLNPEAQFTILEARIDNGKVFVRGEKTMWFGECSVAILDA